MSNDTTLRPVLNSLLWSISNGAHPNPSPSPSQRWPVTIGLYIYNTPTLHPSLPFRFYPRLSPFLYIISILKSTTTLFSPPLYVTSAMASSLSSSVSASLLVLPPTQGNLARRRLTARSLPPLNLALPTTTMLSVDTSIQSQNADLITPAIAHFPPVCPPAPAPPTVQSAARQQHHPLPTIILPDLEPESDRHHHHHHYNHHHENPRHATDNMKAQPSTATSLASRARVNTVYPLPPKRTASSYNHNPIPSRVAAVVDQASQLSPRSASFLARKREMMPVRPSMPYRTSSAMYSSRRTTPPPQQQQYEAAPSQAAQLAHKRAVLAQRQALYARKQEFRWGHVNSLDRGIRLLLEEEYREDVKACLLTKEVSYFFL